MRELPREVRTIDVAAWDDAPGEDLIVTLASGVSWAPLAGHSFAPLREVAGSANLLAGTEDARPRALQLAFDLEGDGLNELVLPTLAGPRILWRDGRTRTLHSPARVTWWVGSRDVEMGRATGLDYGRRTSTTHVSPDVFVVDFDGDGRNDIVTLLDNELRIFAQAADGTLPERPTRTLERSTLSEDEEESGFSDEATAFSDLDGDGAMDLGGAEVGAAQSERSRPGPGALLRPPRRKLPRGAGPGGPHRERVPGLLDPPT